MPSGIAKRCLTASAFLLLAACSRQVRTHTDGPFPKKLSEWRLFRPGMVPNEGVVPYDLNTPLFSDYALKHRYVWMPPGTSAVYDPVESFKLPAGAILLKTFAYPDLSNAGQERLVETRLLVNTVGGWVGLPYVWNDAQTEATLDLAADPRTIQRKNAAGAIENIDYSIPNANQCKGCHENATVMAPIGPKARHLNKDFFYADGTENQLAHWTRIGYLKGAPAPEQASRQAVWDDPRTGSVATRARAYLEVNCAHCHNPKGPANTSGLYLSDLQPDPLRLGFCKVPVSAGPGSLGLRFDMVHGHPDDSILLRRMDSVTPKVMMPELGRSTVHEEGVALIREWVSSLTGDCIAAKL